MRSVSLRNVPLRKAEGVDNAEIDSVQIWSIFGMSVPVGYILERE